MPDENREALGWIDFEIAQQREYLKIPGWTRYALLTSIAALIYFLDTIIFGEPHFTYDCFCRSFLYFYCFWQIAQFYLIVKYHLSKHAKRPPILDEISTNPIDVVILQLAVNSFTLVAINHEFIKNIYFYFIYPGIGIIFSLISILLLRAKWKFPVKKGNLPTTVTLWIISICTVIWISNALASLGVPTSIETKISLVLLSIAILYAKYCKMSLDENGLQQLINLRRSVAYSDIIDHSIIKERINNILWGLTHEGLLREIYKENFDAMDKVFKMLQDVYSTVSSVSMTLETERKRMAKEQAILVLQGASELHSVTSKFDPKILLYNRLIFAMSDDESKRIIEYEHRRRSISLLDIIKKIDDTINNPNSAINKL